jgi:hypothetical protein
VESRVPGINDEERKLSRTKRLARLRCCSPSTDYQQPQTQLEPSSYIKFIAATVARDCSKRMTRARDFDANQPKTEKEKK